jgi:hypothetical protein
MHRLYEEIIGGRLYLAQIVVRESFREVADSTRVARLIAVVDVIGLRRIALQARSVHTDTICIARPFVAASRAVNVFVSESRASGSGGAKK